MLHRIAEVFEDIACDLENAAGSTAALMQINHRALRRFRSTEMAWIFLCTLRHSRRSAP
jgi:hypothetical protein